MRNTLRISSSPERVKTADPPELEALPLRQPDPSLSPAGQAVDLLDCIDEALAWAEGSLQTALRVARDLPARAGARGLSSADLRRMVERGLEEGAPLEWRADPRADPLAEDLRVLDTALHEACTRARMAGTHVMRLALRAPELARRAQAHANRDPATGAWLMGLAEQAKDRADRAREGLWVVPRQAQDLRRRLLAMEVRPSVVRRLQRPDLGRSRTRTRPMQAAVVG